MNHYHQSSNSLFLCTRCIIYDVVLLSMLRKSFSSLCIKDYQKGNEMYITSINIIPGVIPHSKIGLKINYQMTELIKGSQNLPNNTKTIPVFYEN